MTAFEKKLNRPISKILFKKAINGIFCGKDDYLFVRPSKVRNEKNRNDFIVDVFKDGIFINTIMIPELKGYDFHNPDYKIFFKNDKILVINRDNLVITIYSYKIEK